MSFLTDKCLIKVKNNEKKGMNVTEQKKAQIWKAFTEGGSKEQGFWKAVLKIFAKTIVPESLFNKIASCRSTTSLKKRL